MKSKFDYKSAYFHLVSLIGIIVIIIGAINAGNGLLRIAFPVLSMDQYTWERIQSFEAYTRYGDPSLRPTRPQPRPIAPDDSIAAESEDLSEAELRRNWEHERDLQVQGQKRRGLWSLVESLVSLAVAIPIFWWHRRAAKRLPRLEKEKENPE